MTLNKKELAAVTRSVKRAARRVGDRARWLLDFAYRDLSKLDQQGVIDIGFEILAFALAEYKPPKGFRAGFFAPIPFLYSHLDSNGLWSVQPGSFVHEFQRQVRDRFEDCKRGRWWEFTRPGSPEAFTVFRVRTPEGGFFSDVTGDIPSGLNLLLGLATDVVKRERERFGLCQRPGCGIAFVAERRNRAKYHSSKCAAWVRVNRKRGKL